MSTSMDHNSSTPDCPVCIAEVDILKFANTREIESKATSIKWEMWLVYIVYALIAFLAASAIFGQGHQSHVATAGGETSITLAQELEAIELLSKDISHSSIGLAERLQVIESLSQKIRFSLTESAHMMAAKEADTSTSDYSNHGPSLSPDNRDSAAPASSSDHEKKPDDLAEQHPTGNGFQLLGQLLKTILRSIGSADRLLVQHVQRRRYVPSLQTEGAQIMAAQEAGTSATDYPNRGPSSSRENYDSPPAASPSEKKPDAPAAPHPTGSGYLFVQCVVVMILSMPLFIIMANRANLPETDSTILD